MPAGRRLGSPLPLAIGDPAATGRPDFPVAPGLPAARRCATLPGHAPSSEELHPRVPGAEPRRRLCPAGGGRAALRSLGGDRHPGERLPAGEGRCIGTCPGCCSAPPEAEVHGAEVRVGRLREEPVTAHAAVLRSALSRGEGRSEAARGQPWHRRAHRGEEAGGCPGHQSQAQARCVMGL
jgi:hypothetical protein